MFTWLYLEFTIYNDPYEKKTRQIYNFKFGNNLLFSYS